MENPEEILHSLEEFTKLKPKDIPRELEDYLCFVAKTGDPVYQWSAVKSLFREKLINVITEFYESCPTVEIPPCPNVEMFNYDSMKSFILEKLDTFAAAPFTVQRICELLTTPRKEYNRIDKYMRALEKNILVVSTTEPGNRRNTENGDGIVNGIETDHLTEANSTNDINVEEMDDSPSWPRINQPEPSTFAVTANSNPVEPQSALGQPTQESQEAVSPTESRLTPSEPSTSSTDSVITCTTTEKPFVSIEPVVTESQLEVSQDDVSVTITAIPAPVQKRRDSIEPLTSDDNAVSESISSKKDEVEKEAPVKEDVENKADIPVADEDSKQDFKNISITVHSDNIKDDSDIDGKVIEEQPLEVCMANLSKSVEEPDDVKDDEVTKADQPKEEPVSESLPEGEPEIQETCDNTPAVQNVEVCIEDSTKPEPESAVDEIPNEAEIEPTIESVESTPTTEETVILSSDTVNKPVEETCKEKDTPPTEEKDEPIIEESSNETPMEIDPDENLKESSIETSTVDTNLN